MENETHLKTMKQYLLIAANDIKSMYQREIGYSDSEKTHYVIWNSIKSIIRVITKHKDDGKERSEILNNLIDGFNDKRIEFLTDTQNYDTILPFIENIKEASKRTFKSDEDRNIIDLVCDYLYNYYNLKAWNELPTRYNDINNVCKRLCAIINENDFKLLCSWLNTVYKDTRCCFTMAYCFFRF